MNRNPFLAHPEPLHHAGRPRIAFSRTELLHLTASVLVLTLAFAAFMERTSFQVWRIRPIALLAAFLAVGSGFVLHELAHKVVAQRYGHWAEFRAQFSGLGLTLLLAIFTPFLFSAPGAVLIQGRVTPRENGHISLVGPATNFLISAAAFPFTLRADLGAPMPFVMNSIATVNALLCGFNLLPIGPLDGRKVFSWSVPVYVLVMAVAIAWFVFVLARPFNV